MNCCSTTSRLTRTRPSYKTSRRELGIICNYRRTRKKQRSNLSSAIWRYLRRARSRVRTACGSGRACAGSADVPVRNERKARTPDAPYHSCVSRFDPRIHTNKHELDFFRVISWGFVDRLPSHHTNPSLPLLHKGLNLIVAG